MLVGIVDITMEETSFPETHQLNNDLQCVRVQGTISLERAHGKMSTLPGQPRVRLVHHELQSYLKDELLLPRLDRLAPKLWLVSQSSNRLNECRSLHEQGLDSTKFTCITPTSPSCPRKDRGTHRESATAPRVVLQPDFRQADSQVPAFICLLAISCYPTASVSQSSPRIHANILVSHPLRG